MPRFMLVAALAASLLAPAAALAGPAECARWTRQLSHFEGMAERARERGSDLWEARTREHVERLRTRAVAECPELARDDGAMRAFAELLKLAGRAALTYFTFGAL